MNTLNGIFTPSKPHLKNFIVENRRKIRQMSAKPKETPIPKSPRPVTSSNRPKEVNDGESFMVRQARFVQCRNQHTQTDAEDSDHQPLPLPIRHLDDEKVDKGTLDKPSDSPTKKESSTRTAKTSKRSSVRYRGKPKKEAPKIVDPDCPDGHVLLPDCERLDMLEKLKDGYEKRLLEVNRLPVGADTLRVRTKRKELDLDLDRIEENIKLFSKMKVYVKLEDNG